MECNRQIFCHFGLFFALLPHPHPPNNLENQTFEKMKKKKLPGDTILHMRTINDNHMMYGSWNIECDELKFLSFWTIFCTFTP